VNAYQVAFSPDGQRLATGGIEGTVHLWDIKRNTIATIYTRQGIIDNLKFSPNGRWLATCSQLTDKVNLWDTKGNLIATLNTHQKPVYRVEFSPDGQSLATSGGGMVKLWQIGGETELLIRSCNELWDYLHNPNAVLSDSDRHLCDGIGPQK
jgi:WD40 repeat protein